MNVKMRDLWYGLIFLLIPFLAVAQNFEWTDNFDNATIVSNPILSEININYIEDIYPENILNPNVENTEDGISKNNAEAQAFVRPFITVWKTDNAGVTPNNTIRIPASGDFTYTWEEVGNPYNNGSGNGYGYTDITFLIAGKYRVLITPTGTNPFSRFQFYYQGDRLKLIDIEQWGDVEWINMDSAFEGCWNLNISATDAPDLSQVTSMNSMFNFCINLNADFNHWDVTNVTNMSGMFSSAISFNQPLNNWDVSNVTNMSEMFLTASSFNQPLNNWDVSKVTHMRAMFSETSSFNQPLDAWDVSNVSDMGGMFKSTVSFNQPLNNWDVSNVTDMSFMFAWASSFNQALNSWDVSNVTDMSWMFYVASNFNQSLNNWNVGKVTNMVGMFAWTSSFNQSLNSWDVSNVTDMSSMFSGASSFNQPLNNWDVSNVTNMSEMFLTASSFNQSLADWDFPKLEDAEYMFDYSGLSCSNYGETLIEWAGKPNLPNNINLGAIGIYYTSDVASVRNFLINIKNWTITGDILNANCNILPFITVWKTNNVGVTPNNTIRIPASGEFTYTWEEVGNPHNNGLGNGNGTTDIIFPFPGVYRISMTPDGVNPFNQILFDNQEDRRKLIDIEQWGDVGWSSMEAAFYGCSGLNISATDAPNLNQVSNTNRMFANCLSLNANINHWDVSNVNNMENMFANANKFNQHLNSWDVSNVTDMPGMFYGASSFNQPLNSWNVSNVTNMAGLFSGAGNFNQPLNSWDVSNVTDMYAMFQNTYSFDQPLNNWDVSNVTDLGNMFSGAGNFNQSLNSWDVSNVIYMQGMFANASIFNHSLSSWNVSNVIITSEMFSGASSFNQPLNSWDVSNIRVMRAMFENAISFNQPLNNWNVSAVLSLQQMFDGASSFDQSLDSWDVSNVFEMAWLFKNASSFNQPLNNWDVSNVKGMAGLFENASSFNQPLDSWDVSKVVTMWLMFSGAINFNQPLNNWNVSEVFEMPLMFENASSFNQPLNSWDVSNVTHMARMFSGASSFNQPLNSWNVGNVTDIYGMFYNAISFNQPLNDWDVSNVIKMMYMFENAISFNQPLNNWNTNNVGDIRRMFYGASSFNHPVGNFKFGNLIFPAEQMFEGSGIDCDTYGETLRGWVIYNQNLYNRKIDAKGLYFAPEDSWFRYFLINERNWTIAGDVLDIDCKLRPFVSVWKTDNVGDTPNNTIRIPSIGKFTYTWQQVGNPNNYGSGRGDGTTDITFPSIGRYRVRMTPEDSDPFNQIRFYNQNLNSYEGERYKLINIEQWGFVEWSDMTSAFYDCVNLNISANDAPNLNQVTSTNSMFQGCSSFNADINHWNVANVNDMRWMFANTLNFNKILNSWDVSKVVNMSGMFQGSTFNQPLDSWDVSKVTNMSGMFRNSAFNQLLEDWDFPELENGGQMFDGSSLSCINYSKTLMGWAAKHSLPNNINLGASGIFFGYSVITTRDFLINTKNWTLSDDGLDSNCTLIFEDNCDDNIIHSSLLTPGLYKTNKNIESSTNLSAGTFYQAGKSILLSPGFEVGSNEVFEAKIKGCDD